MATEDIGPRGDASRDSACGLAIFRASRMDALLDPLVRMLEATRPGDALTPQTIIAAHPGLRQWLAGALAERYGLQGIAANLDVLLPSAWIDAQAQTHLGRHAVALPRYAQRRLRWTIHAILVDARHHGIGGPRLDVFLQGDGASTERRLFQLADRLARIYSQYLVYRSDWLAAWEAGRSDFVSKRSRVGAETRADSIESELLAPLWRVLSKRLGAHRGAIVDDLVRALAKDTLFADREAVHVFGVSHLAPSELRVLRAAAQTRCVAFYIPDPCREFWGEMSRDPALLRARFAEEEQRIASAGDDDFWVDRPHPLLARWGRLGAHFVFALANLDARAADIRHWRDEEARPSRSRLDRVQQSIRASAPEQLDIDLRDVATREREFADASLRIHSCHTRLRELEVLRDNLLDAMDAAASSGDVLKPSEIVVMAPDIHAYVALIPVVFGVAGSTKERLPYHLADVAVSNSHRLLSTFRRLLDIPASRVTAPEIADLLAVPEIARRFDIEGDGVETLTGWLRQSRVAWALDGAHRQRFELPPISEYTFGWALDRMLAGYLMADAGADRTDHVELADGCELAPLSGIEGPAAEYLGALDQLLREIQAFCALARRPRRASEWANELERICTALFRIDASDRAAREAQAAVLRFVREIAAEPAAAGLDPTLQFAVVRELLVERLSAVPERQRFLMGGITFCGMVPRRAIPFRLIAVLGLNDGEFPRADGDAGLDLMARHRRIGDRDVRSDDRYLFLETVMAARERLHLSYIGEGVRDGKPRNPAPPLSELLEALGRDPFADAAANASAGDEKPRGLPWLVRHPLQPFDARYFDAHDTRDKRLFSFSDVYARLRAGGGDAKLAAFYDGSTAQSVDVERTVTLSALNDYFKNPSRHVLRNRMKVKLDALAGERLREDEPLAARLEAIDRITQRLFFEEALPSSSWPPVEAPAWLRLSGWLPPGRLGDLAWQNEHGKVATLLEALHRIPGVPEDRRTTLEENIDLRIGDWHIDGTVSRVLDAGQDGHAIRYIVTAPNLKGDALRPEGEITFKERIPIFLDWALLRLQSTCETPLRGIRIAVLTAARKPWQDGINAWDKNFVEQTEGKRSELRGALAARVLRLLEIWRSAQWKPAVYFPRTSWSVSKEHDPAEVAESTDSAWFGGDQGKGERDYEPGYNALLAGEWTFAAGAAETSELAMLAHELHALITFDGEQTR